MFPMKPIALIWAACLVLASVVWAVEDVQTGANGAPGAAGGNASASAVSADPANSATATGGTGGGANSGLNGNGGNATATAQTIGAAPGTATGASATATGGNAGSPQTAQASGGQGGAAQANAGATGDGPTLTVTASATGGNGGSGFLGPGSPNTPGGAAGTAQAAASGTLLGTGFLQVTAVARGGEGGGGVGSGNGADGGSPSFGTVFGTSGGDATVSASGFGGAGGGTSSTGSPAHGAGGSVVMNNVVGGVAVGTLKLVQTATGGAGLNGGAATSILDRTTATPTAILDVQSNATGGTAGYLFFSSGSLYYSPGAAAAEARAANSTGLARATSTAQGGGFVTPPVRAGGSVTAAAATASATSVGQGAQALATATGGAGYSGPTGGDFAGLGGAAQATASATSQTSAPASALAQAFGGAGGFGFGGNGGNAFAQATASGSGAVQSTAVARGGHAPFNSQPGTAQALAQAVADATGTSGTVTADASTSRGTQITRSVGGLASSVVFGSTGASSVGSIDRPFSTVSLFSRAAVISVTGSPRATDVQAAFAGNAQALATFPNFAQSSQSLLLAQAGGSGGTGLSSATISASFDPASLFPQQQLQLALLNPQSRGIGFDTLRLRVFRESSAVLDVSFTNLATAQAYFSDHVIVLGDLVSGVSGLLDLSIVLDVTTSRMGDGFGATFYVGNAPVPEPATWLLLGLAGATILVLRRRNRLPG